MTKHVFACGILYLACSLSGWVADAAEWEPASVPLMTRWAADVNPTNVWPDYPRPQLVRPDWMNLNGLWEYALTPSTATNPAAFIGKILVPFPLESALSGVGKPLNDHTKLWYHRRFVVPSAWHTGRVRLHFGAVDWHCQVWVNGRYIGEHQGGYDAFTFDLTPALQFDRPEDILVCVTDPTEGEAIRTLFVKYSTKQRAELAGSPSAAPRCRR